MTVDARRELQICKSFAKNLKALSEPHRNEAVKRFADRQFGGLVTPETARVTKRIRVRSSGRLQIRTKMKWSGSYCNFNQANNALLKQTGVADV